MKVGVKKLTFVAQIIKQNYCANIINLSSLPRFELPPSQSRFSSHYHKTKAPDKWMNYLKGYVVVMT